MQTGFAMLCAGCVRLKNVQNTMLKNLLDACGSAIAWFLIGYSLAFGGRGEIVGTTFVGKGNYFASVVDPSFWFFEYTFSATATTIIAGTLAERCQMVAYLCYSIAMSGFVYPIVVHQIWSANGFLSVNNNDGGSFLGQGAIDFAGSGVVHLTGGITALYATIILGPRRGRFYDEEGEPIEPQRFPGHSVALQLLGTMVLWFGWFGFNSGSALLLPVEEKGLVAANAAVSTALSAAAGGITALFTNLLLEERRTGEYNFIMLMATNGALSGLVAVTSGCAVLEPWVAVVVGMIAGWNYLWSHWLLERFRIDDAVDAIPVHMVRLFLWF
jgi:Amt family ammonium transporter